MPVPKRKKSKSRRDMRKAHHLKIASPSLSKCPQCGAAKLPHYVCIQCGTYNGREIIAVGEE